MPRGGPELPALRLTERGADWGSLARAYRAELAPFLAPAPEACKILLNEMSQFDASLPDRVAFATANKTDLKCSPSTIEGVRDFCKERDIRFIELSALTGEGLEEYMRSRGRTLPNFPPEYRSRLGKEGVEALKEFVREGSRLVCNTALVGTEMLLSVYMIHL